MVCKEYQKDRLLLAFCLLKCIYIWCFDQVIDLKKFKHMVLSRDYVVSVLNPHRM
ncbi:uncharacterized protein METZ01_LOCUS280011 [marine metagenome]|uniref:Uncharacterized protein n=1 Tax=marine metagenome TaxID=408172 RepID=A0A382KWK8_9ZZZZ